MEAVRDAFTRLTNTVYLVLVIEDLQWADRDTLALLGTLLAPLRAPPVLCERRRGRERRAIGVGADGALDLPGDVRRVARQG